MGNLVVRNISEEVNHALRVRAAKNNRSKEAEIRSILEEAVKPKLQLGSALAEFGRSIGLTNEDVEQIEYPRQKVPLR